MQLNTKQLTLGFICVPTISLLGARISSIIMLSRVKELRFRVLDLSELKERRLGVVAVVVTDYQDNSHNDGEGKCGGGGGTGVKGGMEVNRKTNKITLNACSFQEPECMPPQEQTQGKKHPSHR